MKSINYSSNYLNQKIKKNTTKSIQNIIRILIFFLILGYSPSLADIRISTLKLINKNDLTSPKPPIDKRTLLLIDSCINYTLQSLIQNEKYQFLKKEHFHLDKTIEKKDSIWLMNFQFPNYQSNQYFNSKKTNKFEVTFILNNSIELNILEALTQLLDQVYESKKAQQKLIWKSITFSSIISIPIILGLSFLEFKPIKLNSQIKE